MKVILIAINAKYIHTNLAIYSLSAFAKEYSGYIKRKEFTINNYTDDILQDIYKEKPDILAFSCYIWNISMVEELCSELRKLLPNTKIWLGGPEVSFDARNRLEMAQDIDGIMIGEGEETFYELLDYYIGNKLRLEDVKGIVFSTSAYKSGILIEKPAETRSVIVTAFRPEMDMNQIPFPYEGMKELENKIIYYETIRGCPYACSYCLSSIDKKVRFRDWNLVKAELDTFLAHKVPQVKFVDRTFNCNHAHTLAIWNYIKEQDNGITNFHFEISADILDEEELVLLNSMRPGLVQLEIGVQSTHMDTIEAIHRRMNLDKLAYAVKRIHEGKNVHQHLDLIAGLPFEDYQTFRLSFNEVYALKPDQFQLGFLKVLKGSAMFLDSKKYGIVYKNKPPFEVLYTNWLNYDEVLTLKLVEDMVEVYYNSGQFVYTIKYLEHFYETPFDLYLALGEYYEKNHLTGMNHSRLRRYEIIIQFMKEEAALGKLLESHSRQYEQKALLCILVHDLYLRENLKSRPYFAKEQDEYKKLFRDFYLDEQKIANYMHIEIEMAKSSQIKPYMHLEHYDIDVESTAQTGVKTRADGFILYDYMHRSPLNSEARTVQVDLS